MALTKNERDNILDELELLLGQERWAETLGLLEQLPEDDPQRYLQSVDVWLGMGIPMRAQAMLDRGQELAGSDDPLVASLSCRMHLEKWSVAAARAALELVPKNRRDADLEADLALISDLEGQHKAAHKHLARAHKLDKDVYPKPLQISTAEFQALLDASVQELEPDLRAALDRITLTIHSMPSPELVGGADAGNSPDVLAFCDCQDAYACAAGSHASAPHSILLFQRNHERKAGTLDELRRGVKASLEREVLRAMDRDQDY